MSSELKIEMPQAIRSDEATISHAAGKARLFWTEQSVAYGRMNSVCSYEGIGRNQRAILKMRVDMIAVMLQVREAMFQMNAVGRDRIRQCTMQIAPVEGVIRCAESGFDRIPER